jgi:hypothetical protein
MAEKSRIEKLADQLKEQKPLLKGSKVIRHTTEGQKETPEMRERLRKAASKLRTFKDA